MELELTCVDCVESMMQLVIEITQVKLDVTSKIIESQVGANCI